MLWIEETGHDELVIPHEISLSQLVIVKSQCSTNQPGFDTFTFVRRQLSDTQWDILVDYTSACGFGSKASKR